MISVMMAGKMLRKSCPGYLAYAVEVRDDDMRLEDISVVREFPDVFPDDLLGLPPDRVSPWDITDFESALQDGPCRIERT